MKYILLTLSTLILSLIIIQPVTAYSTPCNGLNASLGYRPFANTSGGMSAPNAHISIGCYWQGGTLYTKYSQGVATVFLWNITNYTKSYNEGSENYQQDSQCVNYLSFGTPVPAGNYTINLYAQGPYANASCAPTYVLLDSYPLSPTTATTTIPTTQSTSISTSVSTSISTTTLSTSSSTSTSTAQTTSIPTTTVVFKPVPGLSEYYITDAQAARLFGTSEFSYNATAGLNAAGINYSSLATKYNINSAEGVLIQNYSKGIDALEFVINSTEAETIYNFFINYTTLNALPEMSPTTYGYGKSNGSSQGVNYTIGVISPTGANTYTIIAWKKDKVLLFIDTGVSASQSPTGLATTLNTTLLTNILVNDIAQLPPTTSSTTVNTTTTTPTTTVVLSNQTASNSSNLISNIWNTVTNFFSNLFKGI